MLLNRWVNIYADITTPDAPGWIPGVCRCVRLSVCGLPVSLCPGRRDLVWQAGRLALSAGVVVLEGLYVRFNLAKKVVELAPSVCGPEVTLSEPYTTAGVATVAFSGTTER